ncbi:3',5'-cyclic adenosine monophosphate phosphodiesterase CpdA [compost metagenome]
MKLQIISDLHFDCLAKADRETIVEKIVNPEADYVVLAGDIAESPDLKDFLEKFKDTGKKAIYVPGNHDHYEKHVTAFPAWVKALFESYGHIPLLDNFTIIEDVVFIGGTLWTNISHPVQANSVKLGMLDFKRVRGIGTHWWQNSHINTAKYIEEALKFEHFKDLKKIVVTHHSPSFKACPEKFKLDGLNVAFHSHLDHLMHEEWSPDIWIHGHVHDFCDMVVGNTRLIRNPFGYVAYGEKDTGFQKDFLIDTSNPDSYLHTDQQPGAEAVVPDPFGLLAEVPDVQP